MLGDLDNIHNLVTQIVARDVATGVELARSIGHKMPASFDVGVTFMKLGVGREGVKTRVRIRLDDATYDSIVDLPHLDDRAPSMRVVDAMWRAAWDRIHADAVTMAHVWLNKHPTAFVTEGDVQLSLAMLDAIKDDEELSASWMAACRQRAKRFKYESVPR